MTETLEQEVLLPVKKDIINKVSVLVEVRPLERKKWHGKTGKEDFSQPHATEVLYNGETGGYDTGLTDEEAEAYGKLLGLDLSKTFNPDSPHPYWSTRAALLTLQPFTVFYDLAKPLDYIKVKNLKASKYVANSMAEYNDNKFPDATHVIYDESEQVEIKAGKIALRNKAVILSNKMTLQDKIDILLILSDKKVSMRGRSQEFVDVEMDEVITNKTEDFIKYVDMGRLEVNTRARILECLAKNILTKEGSAIYYMGEQIAFDYEEAVKWFNDPNNTKLKVAILEKLQK